MKPPSRERSPQGIYARLMEAYGPQGWWPFRGAYRPGRFLPESRAAFTEIVLGAVLTQNTAFTNVEKALDNLRSVPVSSLEDLLQIDVEALARLIRPSGYFNQKSVRLHRLALWILSGDFDFGRGCLPGREELLAVKGIGPETADSLLLFAWGKPEMVIDAYTRRIFSRLGFCEEKVGYEELKRQLSEALPPEVSLYNEFHALVVRLAKEHCRKRNPDCRGCPLLTLCQKTIQPLM